jgi:hypothetical protein
MGLNGCACTQDLPSSVPQLQAELQRTRGERDSLETRLKLLLQTRRAAGDSSAAAEASAAAAQLQSTPNMPGVRTLACDPSSHTTFPSDCSSASGTQKLEPW